MRNLRIIVLLLFFGNVFTACVEDMDDVVNNSTNLEIKNFIWRGMNNIYLYKEDVPELADNYFGNPEELNEFLEDFATPEELFYDALVAPQDEFSFLVNDYVELENALEGIAVTNGMEFGLVRYSESSSMVLGYVRYVLPNTSAEEQGVQRGHLFSTINGQQLTVENYASLIELPEYTIGLATLENSEVTPTDESITLTKEEYTENPVFLAKTFQTDAGKVGYLMYNSFTGSFDEQLNEAFAAFQSEGINDLIVDLRYNGGGSVESSVDLASMITGQFEGEIFSTERWNEDYQSYYEENEPEQLVNLFNSKIRTGESINSLNLSKVYIISTLRTASASELLINGLKPYIDVVQVGERTTGKFQASVTLYDSPDFRRAGANPGHTYAIQPLIYKSANAAGVTDYLNGLTPNIKISEDLNDLGIIGDSNEPLLQAALNNIRGKATISNSKQRHRPVEIVGESGMKDLLYKEMYKEELPSDFPFSKN